MTKEQLMIPRFKVIMDYPQSTYKVGDTLTDNGKSAVLNQKGDAVFAQDWQSHPKIFEQLEWWQEREIQDMPTHLKVVKVINGEDCVGEIIKAIAGSYSVTNPMGYKTDGKFVTGFDNIRLGCFEPSTEEEFNSFIGGQEKNKKSKN